MTIRKVSPYEAHLIAAADEVIRLRGEVLSYRPDVLIVQVGSLAFVFGLLAGLAV